MTINQIKKIFQTIAENHNQIKTFGFGQLPEFRGENAVTYPLWWVVQRPSKKDGNDLKLEYDFLFADLVHKGLENEIEVISDQMQIAEDVIAQLQHPDYDFTFEPQSDFENFYAKQDDEISGWKVRCSITVANPYDRCAIPYINSPEIDNPSGRVTIYENDGVTVYGYVSNDGYFILPPGGSASGTVNVYLDGELQSSTPSLNLDAEIVNILWT